MAPMSYVSLLVLATFVALWYLMTVHRGRLGLSRLSVRGTFVLAQIPFQALVVLITEALSNGHHLTPGLVAFAWLLAGVVLGGLVVLHLRRRSAIVDDAIPETRQPVRGRSPTPPSGGSVSASSPPSLPCSA